jgi:hypothetical protein
MSDFPKGRWFPGKSGSMYRLRKKGTKKKKGKPKRHTSGKSSSTKRRSCNAYIFIMLIFPVGLLLLFCGVM